MLEAARAINDLPIDEALPQTWRRWRPSRCRRRPSAEHPASEAGPKPTGTPAEWIAWRAVNANFRLGTPDAAKALAAFAARDDAPAGVRIEALEDLGEWAKPRPLDHITNLYRPLAPRDRQPARDAAAAGHRARSPRTRPTTSASPPTN